MNKITLPFFCFISLLVFTGCSTLPLSVKKIPVHDEIRFITADGMKGCENLAVARDGSALYVTDLAGSLHVFRERSAGEYVHVDSWKFGFFTLGIDKDRDGAVYIAASGEEWQETGGAVLRVAEKNGDYEKISGNFPGINGLAIDSDDNIYFAAGNFSFFNPEGNIYIMRSDKERGYGKPEIFLYGLKSPNGLCFDESTDSLLFTETFHGVKRVDLTSGETVPVFGKSRLVEGFDDLCIDSRGNYWVADPPNGLVKMYDPESGIVTRFIADEFGIASSCRTAVLEGKEYLFVTEIKTSGKSKEYDGRGVLVIPVNLLLNE